VAADLRKNVPLAALLDAAAWPEIGPPPQAWLGAAVAIKEPTSITLARHAGCHLLVVGHQEESALGILASCLLSLAAQHAPTEPNGGPPATLFYLLDGTRADSPAAGFWNRLVRAIPHEVRTTQGKTATALLAEIAEELACREAAGHEGRPSIYVFIYDVARFRELRRSDDDFGFSRTDDDQRASPAAQFARILREGPALGIHVLAWCDGYNTVNRTLDRQGLRELQLRVLFQMNATDSANLIDSPAASQLGVHRAILYDEGEGRLEKFRPYGPPADEWLAWIERRFQQRLPAPAPEGPG
jgi:hypothetical protein